MRTINFFVVVLKDSPTKIPRFFTITNTKKEAEEYINALYKAENITHYKSWCELRNLNKDNDNSWKLYCSTVLAGSKKYVIMKMNYKLKDIASLFRMYNKCVPLGCSFEDSMELPCFLESLSTDLKNKITESIKETMEEKK